jgi:hypothetical protein
MELIIQRNGIKSRSYHLLFPYVLTPEDWNSVVDALNELDSRTPVKIKGGVADFTGDGTRSTFTIAHSLEASPTVALVGKKTSGIPDIDFWDADETNITVVFKSPPDAGKTFQLWWLAVKL